MKLIAPRSRSAVSFGPETEENLHRAAAFLCNVNAEWSKDLLGSHDAPWELVLEKPVATCTTDTRCDDINFGTLASAGLLERDIAQGPNHAYDRDDITVVWKVVQNVNFTDAAGHRYTWGDVILWDK